VLDLAQVREAYALILAQEPREAVERLLANAQEVLVAKLLRKARRLDRGSEADLRALQILAENPLLLRPEHEEGLVKQLFLLLGGLEGKARVGLTKRLATYAPEGLERLVVLAQLYLHHHILPSDKAEAVLVGTVRFLKCLALANEYNHAPLLPIITFYCAALSKALAFKDEYRHWRRLAAQRERPGSSRSPPIPGRERGFAFFDYPFLFDPVAKSRIMHIDGGCGLSP
jgi:ubiquitin-protein ligase E3 A